jgi:hypothetical protein
MGGGPGSGKTGDPRQLAPGSFRHQLLVGSM